VAEPAALALGDLLGWLPPAEGLALVGPGADAAAEALRDTGLPVRLLDAEPSARYVAALGAARYGAGEVENAAAWEPYYLKAFVAAPAGPIFGGRGRAAE
jgi:hypothetical protein